MESNGPVKGSSPFAVLKSFKRRKAYVLIPMVVITAGVAAYTYRLPERFRAEVVVAAEPSSADPYLSGRTDGGPAANVQDQLRAIRETLLGPSVLEPVVREFNLYPATTERAAERALESMRSRIQIQVEAPDAFRVAFEGDSPQQVMRVANRIAALFVNRVANLRGEHVARVDGVLDGEVERLRSQLRDREEGLKTYKERKSQDLPDRLTSNLKLLEDLQQQEQLKNDRITEGQAQRMAVVEELQALEKQGALDPEPEQRTPTETALDDLRLKLKHLQTQYTPEHPEIQRTEKEIRDLESVKGRASTPRGPSPIRLRYIALQADLKSIDQKLKSYEQERAGLSSQIARYESRIDAAPGLETDLSQRLRDIALTRTQYETLLAKQQTEKLDQKVARDDKRVAFRVVEPAQLPTGPSSPKRVRIILLALLGSLAIGFGAAFLAGQMDSSFDTVEDFQSYATLPVLSAIPGISGRPPKGGTAKAGALLESMAPKDDGITAEQRQHFLKHRLAVPGDPHSIPAQQFGILALKVHRWRDQTGGRTLVVTSSAGGEGKSLTALNLSMALASSAEERVLLIDCDLRRPKVHERLALEGAKGLSDLMAHADRDIEPYISKVGNLYVMPGGTRLTDDVCLQASRRTEEILARARKEYRLVVMDSPPIVPIADSHYLAGLGDGLLFVVRARQTRRELFRRAVESLESSNILGVVLNDVEYGDTGYAYAYRYYQRHYLGRY